VWSKVFVKGVGDGAMVVAELDAFIGLDHEDPDKERAHLCEFLKACIQYVRTADSTIPKELAVGCGISHGTVLETFLFGQTDYLGEAINEAAELQQLAWNEVVISPAVQAKVSIRGVCGQLVVHQGTRMAERGFRINPFLDKKS
jgi:class 3 adenylate cyclase